MSMLIHHQRTAVYRANELMLLQSTNSVLQMMKQDLHRAGYSGGMGSSLKLSGAAQTYYIRHDNQMSLIAYAYLSGNVEDEEAYTNVVYQRDRQSEQILRVCEKKLSRVMSVVEAESFTTYFGNTCNTLFDSRRIAIEVFELNVEPLVGLSISSALVSVVLSTQLVDQLQVTQSLGFSVKTRNW
ncbi:pilus assembly protein PilW [Vibrio sp. Isolate23]|uniref:pilus assembly protein PilW n=1 Tax=Vibrio sp. Isolate23 TaxID=2908533 RepID=UPI001EFE4AE7|nr:pilus assembly protein PilW [Vibrio sp. Isolate23]